jgi:signal transduction histidine kinase
VNTPLARARRRLALWYVGVFTLILAGFGGAVYTVVNRQMLRGIDRSLERTVDQRTRWVLARRAPTLTAQDSALYERRVVVFNAQGEPFSPAEAEPWLRDFAARVLKDSILKHRVRTPDGKEWQLYGKRVRSTAGRTWATVAVADIAEVRDRFPSIVTGFAASAVFALLLVAIGGAALARRSTHPVELAFDQMRRFIGDAAHELKTPIAVLRARADVALQRRRSPKEYEEVLTGISQEAERLGGLVENMLLLARADAGQWPLRCETVILDDLLLDAASAARALADRKGVTIDIGELEESRVRGDPALLRQLFMVILDNAVAFTPAGGHIRASVRNGGRRCHVTIADTGVGIPAAALPHVFDRFFRADPARSRAGAGLGLSIARWIVDQHHARIELSSREGEGTTVEMSFPTA